VAFLVYRSTLSQQVSNIGMGLKPVLPVSPKFTKINKIGSNLKLKIWGGGSKNRSKSSKTEIGRRRPRRQGHLSLARGGGHGHGARAGSGTWVVESAD
jgi:hypothetical protein